MNGFRQEAASSAVIGLCDAANIPSRVRRHRSASVDKEPCDRIEIRIVKDDEMSARARTFLRRVYARSGLVRDGSSPDPLPHPEKFTVLAENTHREPLATVSLVFDSDEGLPCDPVFPGILAGLRAKQRKIAEVVSLAVDREGLGAMPVLVRMFGMIYLHAVDIEKCHDFVIEVHPSHAGFYERAFGFTRLSGRRSCPRAGGAEAVLLRLDLALARRTIMSWVDRCLKAGRRELRSL